MTKHAPPPLRSNKLEVILGASAVYLMALPIIMESLNIFVRDLDVTGVKDGTQIPEILHFCEQIYPPSIQ